MARHRVVIQHHQPGRKLGLSVLAGLLIALAAWGLYRYTRQNTVADFEKATSERDQLMNERRELSRQLRAAKAEVAQLKDDVAFARQSSSIDGDSCKEIHATLAKLEGEAASLREQLAFYRGIASPNQSGAGVRVQDLRVRKSGESWHYELVLIQSVREETRIAGKAGVTIEGVLNGKTPQTLDLAGLVSAGDQNLVFSFKYFEEFSGDFKLPAGFKPSKVTVKLTPVDARPEVVDEYPWASIEAHEERSRD